MQPEAPSQQKTRREEAHPTLLAMDEHPMRWDTTIDLPGAQAAGPLPDAPLAGYEPGQHDASRQIQGPVLSDVAATAPSCGCSVLCARHRQLLSVLDPIPANHQCLRNSEPPASSSQSALAAFGRRPIPVSPQDFPALGSSLHAIPAGFSSSENSDVVSATVPQTSPQNFDTAAASHDPDLEGYRADFRLHVTEATTSESDIDAARSPGPATHVARQDELPNCGLYPVQQNFQPTPMMITRYSLNGPGAYVTFWRSDGADGIFLSDMLAENFKDLAGADDELPVYARNVTLYIDWPGYRSWSTVLRTHHRQEGLHKPVTRCMMANRVARRMGQFVKSAQPEAAHPAPLTVGPHGIGLDRMVLRRLVQKSQGAWQIEIAVKV
ncbi:hypothetical protein EVG20_g8514 [Dentipellis fragilis]|uniref:Uncharacterized protein n=1 Tax=Dentipellis fragilis TaxID=205917 RepID=A0A4Y9Y588_9AGAM|nr:hypothetical protein EVG20_g8514 [Dentipellis fragilis]